jgi:DNA-binding NtrC family response regulator
MLLGESGTGKELVARALHEASVRAARPLVVVDCASLTETLFESELFGHERGAFTGAHASKAGLVEAASGGTLFLDEVGDIPLSMQVKLLRLLENGTYRRVGSTELRQTDVRVVSATHRDLDTMVAEGRFREDLYYRLSTFPIRLPALRDRVEDIPLLTKALLARLAPKRRLKLSSKALARLVEHAFPGNVRELRNVLERVVVLSDGDVVDDQQVEVALSVSGRAQAAKLLKSASQSTAASARTGAQTLRDIEREALVALVRSHVGSRAALAQRLGISERSLYRKLSALNVAVPLADREG